MTATDNRRVLVVDDNVAIHDDYTKILSPAPANDTLADLENLMFGDSTPAPTHAFMLQHAYQGLEAVELVSQAVAEGRPFALAFVDMRMPPGIDGMETIERMWRIDPALQIVICSAHTDYTWPQLHKRLGRSDSLLIVKKPFDTVEILQIAYALTEKWNLVAGFNHRLAREIAERDRVEVELRLAQKLEAVGQLAAGVAHEINTPIQYVGDSLQFIRESAMTLVSAVAAMREASAGSELAATLASIDEEADLQYLAAEMPSALEAVQGGVSRIATIVRAMKELSHPGPREAVATDLNHALSNALELTANQYKYVADVALELGNLPRVTCFPSDLNQVFLNLIVNAAQAMEDKKSERKGKRGKLSITSKLDGDEHVVIAISDTGGGIPEAIRARVYDAFFTTKEVGRGTGQGLAISRTIIVDRHRGSLWFDSEAGIGTTFYIRLPIRGPREPSARLSLVASA